LNESRKNFLGKGARIRKRDDFRYVRESGRNRAGRYCAVQIAPPRRGVGTRTAIVISRYFSSKAVERNRARRIIREACRAVIPGCSEDIWLVLRPRQPIKKAKTFMVAEDLRRTLAKCGVAGVGNKSKPESGIQGIKNKPPEKSRENKPETWNIVSFLLCRGMLLLIRLYRLLLSPFKPACCRFTPSCSKYAEIAFKRFGFCRALILVIWRILRCHPFYRGPLYDPVPEKKPKIQ